MLGLDDEQIYSIIFLKNVKCSVLWLNKMFLTIMFPTNSNESKD